MYGAKLFQRAKVVPSRPCIEAHRCGTKAEAESSFQCRLRFAGSSVYLQQLPFEYLYTTSTAQSINNNTT